MDTSEVETAKLPDQPFLPQAKMTASVEGPYGHEVPYHLMYENLILVAGGIGISPFLAILSDILHRINDGKPCLPKNVLVVWAVKKLNEIPLLSTVDMESICPHYLDKLNLEVSIYVTRETDPELEEEGIVYKAANSSICTASKGYGMSVLVGTGDNIWSGLYVISSTVGYVILLGLLDVFYINRYGIQSWWYKGLLFLVCMFAGIFIFGGCVVGLWHLWERKTSAQEEYRENGARGNGVNAEKVPNDEDTANENFFEKNHSSSTLIQYGSRPDFKEILGSVSKRWGFVDVGLIICGPPTLQSSVAKEIRSQNLKREFHDPIFHFHSHSFDL